MNAVTTSSVGRAVLLAAVLALLFVVATPEEGHTQKVGTARLVLRESGEGNRLLRSPFAVQHAPWFVSWHFDCAAVHAGQRHTVLSVSDARVVNGEVVRNGLDEAAVTLTYVFRQPSEQDRLFRKAWRRGTSGTLTFRDTGVLFTVGIVTQCRWRFQVTESAPVTIRLPGPGSISRRFPVARSRPWGIDSKPFTVPWLLAERMRWRSPGHEAELLLAGHRTPAPFDLQESLLARPHSSTVIDGCTCWVLVRRAQPPIQIDLAFVDAITGRWKGETTLRYRYSR
jgi:hypothetical protein